MDVTKRLSLQFDSELKADVIIDVFIGTDNEPMKVQQSLLTSTSPYFVKAIQHQSMGNGQVATLRFPEDTSNAWAIFLWWRTKGGLPVERLKMRNDDVNSYLEA